MKPVRLFILALVTTAWAGLAAPEPPPDFKPEIASVDFTSRRVRPGDPFAITVKFRNDGTKPAASDYRVFLHFESMEKHCSRIEINQDHMPPVPTSAWKPGEVVADGPRLVEVPNDTPEQEYFVHIGLYSTGGDGKRLLDSEKGGTITVSRQAPPAEDAAPKPMPREEVEKRRLAMAQRIPAQTRAGLKTDTLVFDLDRSNGTWMLTDKSTGIAWNSNPARPGFGQVMLRNGDRSAAWNLDRFDEVLQKKNSLHLTSHPLVDGAPSGVSVEFAIEAVDDPDGIEIRYESRSTGAWQVAGVRLLDNALPLTEEDGGVYYLPHRLGIELPAAKGFPGHQQWTTYDNLSMAMCGAVKGGSALLVSWNEVDTRLSVDTSWPDLPLVPGSRMRTLSLEIVSPKGACTIYPLGRGGYVKIAQTYRPIAEAKGWRMTWSKKRTEYPSVDNFLGAVNFKPFVFSRVLPSSRFNKEKKERTHLGFTFDEIGQCAEHWRRDLGIERAAVVLAGWINGGYDVRHPDVLPAAPECGGDSGLADAAARIKACGYLFGLHDNYQDMYEDAPSWDLKWLNKNPKGEPRRGGNWNGGQAWQVCAIQQVKLAERRETNLPRIAKLFGPTIYFIDTVFAWGLVTCEDPAHPMARRDDMRWKTELCRCAKRHFGLFGSEEGREWSIPCADYLEGLFNHQTTSPPGAVIPLFPLVYSDCVQIMTHQGERVGPGDEKKIADLILFAEMPLPRFGNHLYWKNEQPRTPGANELWARADGGWGADLGPTDRVIKNIYEVLSPLNLITSKYPLDNHEFVSPDRLLQRTRLGPVNISVAYEKPARIGDNTVPAYGFIVDSPKFIAFCATRFGGIDYPSPTLFTVRSLDNKPIAESGKVRIYHGFGDKRIRLFGKDFEVAREAIVQLR
jgi:hypothetical protein